MNKYYPRPRKNKPQVKDLISKEELQKLILESKTQVEVLYKLFSDTSSVSAAKFRRICKFYGLEEERLTLEVKIKHSTADIFKLGKSISRAVVRKRIISENLLDYICQGCGTKPIWCGKEMILDLDHINGNNKDNRLDNLRFLCKNCHSQTDTYMHKNLERKIMINKCACGSKKSKLATFCKICTEANFPRNKTDLLTKEELTDLMSKYSLNQISYYFGHPRLVLAKKALEFGLKATQKPNISEKLIKATKEELEEVINKFPQYVIARHIYRCQRRILLLRMEELGLSPKEPTYWKTLEGIEILKKTRKELIDYI